MQISFPSMFLPLLCATLGLHAFAGNPNVPVSARQTVNFDAGWHFLKGDAMGAEKTGFNDAAWTVVNVPHDWSIQGPYDEKAPSGSGGGFLPTGVSWYRKTFTLPPEGERKVFIDFDGVMANSKVWINGHLLGERPYGYIGFRYDLTPYLEPGQANLLAVRTDTSLQPASRWYTGQGIYRHVRLVAAGPVHIAHWGICVRTPKITKEQALVEVITTVVNDSKTARNVALQTVLNGPDGKETAKGNAAMQKIEPGKSVEFTQTLAVANPSLWSLETPSLYKASVSVVADHGLAMDTLAQPFGIRSFAFKAESGFWLNGKHVKIQGVCLHHDGGAVGAAVPLRIWERRLEILRTLGVNAVRTSHNPPAPEFLDLCDRMGFLVMLESFDTWTHGKKTAEKGYNLYFKKWWKTDWSDILRWDRNHPSIVIWSIGNEIDGRFGVRNTGSTLDDLVAQVEIAHRLDPTRPVTQALIAPRKKGQIPSVTSLFDVAGANYRAAELLMVAKDGQPVISTEETHEENKAFLYRYNPSLSGCFLWTGVDYIGETFFGVNGWPYVISSNDRNVGFGLLEIGDTIRPRGYQRQSWWTEKPMVSMARYASHGSSDEGTGELLRDWTPKDPAKYDKAVVEVYSNTDEVELFLNGKSLGAQKVHPSGMALTWLVPYAPGTLKAVAKKGGQVAATDEWKTAGAPAKIALSTDRAKVAPVFDDVACVRADVVDAKGVVCPNANQLLKFEVAGPGKVIGVASGERTSHRPFVQPEREAYHGACIGIVRATAPSGPVTVTVSAPGLSSSAIKIQTTAP